MNDTVWVDIEKKGRSFIIPDSERSKLDKVYLNLLSRLGLTPAPPCGAKAQLTPTPPTENPQAGYTPTSAQPSQETARQPETATPPISNNVVDLPQPTYEYVVESAHVQNGMNSQATSVVLKDAEGKTIKAFARGLHAALTHGAVLTNVKLSVKKQGTVVFHFLESYELAGSTRAA